MLIIHSESLRLSDAGWTLPRSSNQLYSFYPKDCVRHQEENQREATCLQRDTELLSHKTWNNGFSGMEPYAYSLYCNSQTAPLIKCLNNDIILYSLLFVNI